MPKQQLSDPNQGSLLDIQVGLGFGMDSKIEELQNPELLQVTPTTDVQEVTANAVDIRERAELLLRSLGHLAEVSQRAGLEKAIHTDEQPRVRQTIENPKTYPSSHNNYEGTLEGASFLKAQEMKRAKSSFLSAYNLGEQQPVTANDDEFIAAFESFSQRYGVGGNPEQTKRKKAQRAQLSKRLAAVAMIDGEFAPDVYTPVSEESPITQKQQPELANTRIKLEALNISDKRAGFLPATHREKSQAYELLDYRDLAKHRKGIDQRLDEIFFRQKKLGLEKGLSNRDAYNYGQEAITSILHTWGDYLRNANVSHAELVRLKEQLDSGISPRISTVEATEPEGVKTFDYNAIVRFVNLCHAQNGIALDYDPLRTKEDRTIIHPTKNKIVEDVHTGFMTSDEIREFIDAAAENLSVKDSRVVIDAAIADQAARSLFWHRALKTVKKASFREKADAVLHEVTSPAAA